MRNAAEGLGVESHRIRRHRRSNEQRILGTLAKTPDQVQLAEGCCHLGGFQPLQTIRMGETGLLPVKPCPPVRLLRLQIPAAAPEPCK